MNYYRILSLVIYLFCYYSISLAQPATTIEVSGDILKDSIWDADTVKITDNVFVGEGVTLTINPGTYIEFQGHYSISVRGWLMAIGKENDTIVFTINDTTGFSNTEIDTGGWGGLRFPWGSGGIDTSKLICCKIEYAKTVEADDLGGAISVHVSKIIISRCNITRNIVKTWGGGVHIEESYAIIKNNMIHNNFAELGGGLSCHNNATVILIKNIIRNNTADRGGGFHFNYSRSVIDRNIICNNYSASYGGGFTSTRSADIVTGNLIVNNSSGYMAGGCRFNISVPEFHNNTLCNNASPWYGGILITSFCNSNFTNNIIWGNVSTDSIEFPSQIGIPHTSSNPNFNNNIVQNGTSGIYVNPDITYTGDTLNVFNLNPQFINPTDSAGYEYDGLIADWNIQDISPCINLGLNETLDIIPSSTDLIGNPRIIHGYMDIGAYEKRINKLVKSGLISSSAYWIADTIEITDGITVTDSAILNIAPGTYIEFQDHYEINIEGTLLAEGTEQDPIWFTIADTTGFADTDITGGGWRGISFNNGYYGANGNMSDNDTSMLIHCIVEYAKNDGDYTMSGGGIKSNYFSNLIIKNCTIRNNYGISGGGIGLKDGSNPIIENNIIYNNNAGEKGGGLSCESRSEPRIINNFISNNSVKYEEGWPRGGGGISCASADPVILGNIICNNSSPSYGGGVAIFDSYPLFANNTVCNNKEFSYGGGGIHTGTSPVIYNSIIWGNNNIEGPEYAQVGGSGNPDIYHCNIQEGLDGIIGQDMYSGQTVEILDADPQFASPTEGAGLEYDGLGADWNITGFSPNINAGTPDVSALDLPETDFAGNPRINHDIVDIGAYESQAEPLKIIQQPVNLSRCEGDSVSFEVVPDGPALYQWFKNLDTIPGATESMLTIDPVSLDDEANYNCIVSNGYGPVPSNNVFLVVKTHPKILIEPESQWVDMNKPLNLRLTVEGTTPISYQWMKDGVKLEEGDLPEFNLATPSYNDEGVYSCVIANSCSETTTNPFTLYMAPQICMVTVDPATGNNLVVWEKNSAAPISYYKIYRESNYAGIFDLLAIVPYDDLSIVLDTTADPTSRAYIYRITAVDTSDYETDKELSNPHKTIHLLVTANPETHATQLDWDRYVGFDYGTYLIYRSDTTYGFSEIDQMSSSTSTWADNNPGEKTKYYRIAALKPSACLPTGNPTIKADSGPYSHAMSNIEDNRLQEIKVEQVWDAFPIQVFPNPFSQTARILFNNPEGEAFTFTITDLSGKICRIENDNTSSELWLEKGNLKEGFYYIELRGPEKIFRGKIIIK